MDSPRKKLKTELLSLIKPFYTSRDKPPFSVDELVVISLATSTGGTSMTQLQVREDIWRSYAYYLDLFISHSSLATRQLFEPICLTQLKSKQYREDFDLAFRKLDVPIECTLGTMQRLRQHTYTVSPEAARIFLSRILRKEESETKESKPFPFVRLPAELRNRIYELVLQFSDPGVSVKVKDDGSRI